MEAPGDLDLADDQSSDFDSAVAPFDAAAATVVAVVVTRNPDVALDDTLASLATQDHTSLSILVIDDGSDTAVFDRVAAVAPGAYVRRFDQPVGYGAAANVVGEMVQGAAYFLFCHDDVALAPDAVRLLLTAAGQQRATIVGPKLVAWEDHERFWSLGYTVDRSGQVVSPIELDELDQGQHDQVREVTALHGASLLVASETFRALGGFLASLTDPKTATVRGSGVAGGPDLGEDIDLCLRARRRGDRIVVVPAARVAHQGVIHGVAGPVVGGQPGRSSADGPERAPQAEQRLLRDRNRIRTIVAGASATRLVMLVPILIAQALRRGSPSVEATGGRRGPFTALRLALGTKAERRQARQLAGQAGSDDLGHELVAVSSRLRAGIRSDVTADTARLWRATERAVGSRRGGRFALVSLALTVAAVVFGSRGLIGSGIGRGGRLVPLPPVGDLWRQVASGWHEPGLGQFGAAAPGLILTAIVSTALLGLTGLSGTLLALGPLAIGAVGMFRAASTTEVTSSGSEHRRGVALAASITYLLVPLPFDALSAGNRGTLWGYALLPWLMAGLERVVSGEDRRAVADRRASTTLFTASLDAEGAGERRAAPGSRRHRWGLSLIATLARPAMLLAIFAAADPTAIVVWTQVLVLAVTGAAITRGRGSALRVLRRGAAVLGGTLVLLAPWVVSLVRARAAGWTVTGGDAVRTTTLRIDQLLRLQSAPHAVIGLAPLAGVFVVAAIFPLLVADGSRFALAVRCWTFALGSVLLAWAMGRGWLPPLLSGPSMALLPAAYALSRASGEGLGALVGEVRSRGFGWRQGLAALSLASVALSAVPIAAAAADGRWGRPERATVDKLAWMRGLNNGGFRVAFIGDPSVLPATAVRLGPSLGVAISRDGVPTISDQWAVNESGRTGQFNDSLDLARLGATTRLGAQLAPLGIRYLVLVESDRNGGTMRRVPADLREALLDQLDLRAVDTGGDLIVYENDAWVPAVWSPLASSGLERNGVVNTAGASNALDPVAIVPGGGADADARLLEALRWRPPSSSFVGTLDADAEIVASLPPSRHWRLRVGSTSSGPVPLAGIIDAGGTSRVSAPLAGFTARASGPARLSPRRPLSVTGALVAAAVWWAGALVLAGLDRRRRRVALDGAARAAGVVDELDEDPTDEPDDADVFADDEFASPFTVAGPGTPRRTAAEPVDDAPADDAPADGSVADELWTAFAARQRGGRGDSVDTLDTSEPESER